MAITLNGPFAEFEPVGAQTPNAIKSPFGDFVPIGQQLETAAENNQFAGFEPIGQPAQAQMTDQSSQIPQELLERSEAPPIQRSFVSEARASMSRSAAGMISSSLEGLESFASAINPIYNLIPDEYKLSKHVSSWMDEFANDRINAPSEAVAGRSILSDPGVLAEPNWYADVIGSAVPSAAAFLVPGAALGKVAQAAGYGAKGVALASRVGMGIAGFTLEGGAQYKSAIDAGSSEWAARAEGVAVGSINAGLEVLGIGPALGMRRLDGVSAGALTRWGKDILIRGAMTGGSEGATEAMQEWVSMV